VVDAFVTRRTQREDFIGTIGSTCTEFVNVMNFEIWFLITIEKRCRFVAALTVTTSACLRVLFDWFSSMVT
jgi:hypothetical protein